MTEPLSSDPLPFEPLPFEPLPVERCLDVLTSAGAGLASGARRAGLDAPLATCPDWTVADLVAHQGMVHRWAEGQVRLDETAVPSAEEFLASMPPGELLDWFAAGVESLAKTLRDADPDVPAMVFLKDAPAPRHFWARRQAHETAIHAVDALSAALGRVPTAAEARIDDDVALDGIDELLTGFFTRGRSKLAGDEQLTVAVAPADADRGWTLRVADGRLTAERERRPDADTTLSGTAAQLYLGLWNRGGEITESGRPGVLQRWREVQRVRWS